MKKKSLLTRTFYGFFITYLFCYTASSFAESRFSPAQVLDKDGLPCFTVQNGEKAGLVSLNIAEVSENLEEMLDSLGEQSIGKNQKPILLLPPKCLLYGTRLNKNNSFEPKKLETNKIYKVSFIDVLENQKKAYQAYFCLAVQRNGEKKVHQIFYDGNRNEWNVNACKPLNSLSTAQVLDTGGTPCFTVRSNEKANLFDRLRFSEISENMKKELDRWEYSIGENQASILLAPPSCFRYGTQTNKNNRFEEKKLESGKIYKIGFFTLIENRGQAYQAYFCLAPTENGKTKVHQIFYDNEKSAWDINACTPLNPTILPLLPPVHPVKIFDEKGVPCFTVKNNEKEKVQLRAIYIYNEFVSNTDDKDPLQWEIQVPQNGNLSFDSRICLPYGEKSKNTGFLPKEWLPPHPLYLEPNQLYRMELTLTLGNQLKKSTENSRAGIEDYRYMGYFCLSRTKNGKTKVHEVPYNEQKKEWDFEVCDRLSEEQYEK
jgi:hypothetical protein